MSRLVNGKEIRLATKADWEEYMKNYGPGGGKYWLPYKGGTPKEWFAGYRKNLRFWYRVSLVFNCLKTGNKVQLRELF